MREQNKVFHLAIPTHSIQESVNFYVHKLGCKLARQYDDRVTIDFFGDQIVCHLSPDEIDLKPKMYPRHFGVTFIEREEFERLYRLAQSREIQFYKDMFTRFKETPEEHSSFFLQDPSNNLLEFKYYSDPRMIY